MVRDVDTMIVTGTPVRLDGADGTESSTRETDRMVLFAAGNRFDCVRESKL